LPELDRAIGLSHWLSVPHKPSFVMHVQIALLVSNRFGHFLLL
jgi:hypothetical protein